jgi:hypothetical protein
MNDQQPKPTAPHGWRWRILTELPKQPGLYWFKASMKPGRAIVSLYQELRSKEWRLQQLDDKFYNRPLHPFIHDNIHRFCGPIPEPEGECQ